MSSGAAGTVVAMGGRRRNPMQCRRRRGRAANRLRRTGRRGCASGRRRRRAVAAVRAAARRRELFARPRANIRQPARPAGARCRRIAVDDPMAHPKAPPDRRQRRCRRRADGPARLRRPAGAGPALSPAQGRGLPVRAALVGSAATAADVTQDVFVHLLQRAGDYDAVARRAVALAARHRPQLRAPPHRHGSRGRAGRRR